jgi:ribosomal protein L7/L12
MAIDYVGFLRQALDSGVPLDVALAALRRKGASPIESIKAIREVRKVPLIEAKRITTSPRHGGTFATRMTG